MKKYINRKETEWKGRTEKEDGKRKKRKGKRRKGQTEKGMERKINRKQSIKSGETFNG